MKNLYSVCVFVMIIILSFTTIAQENIQENISNTTNNTTNTSLINDVNITQNEENDTNISNDNMSNETPQIIKDLTLVSFIPSEFKLGDVQLNILVKNTGNVEIEDIDAVVSGKGFASYDIIPIDLLKPGEKSYIIVSGNFKEIGNITLKIKIEEKVFYHNVTVLDPNAEKDIERLKEIEEVEAKKNNELVNISAKLEELQQKYIELENVLEQKRKDYELSDVYLTELKKYIRDGQSSVIVKDLERAKADLKLALDEYKLQKERIENAKLVKRNIFLVLKDNALIISSIAGALIALFTLFEILKKKKEQLYQKIKEVNINGDTKIVVKKKRKSRKKKEKNIEENKEKKEDRKE